MADRIRILQEVFYLSQIVLGTGFVAYLFYFRARQPKSGFRVREAELYRPQGARFPAPISAQDSQSQERARAGRGRADGRTAPRKAAPLRLPGIRIDVPPHEILGISKSASVLEIQKAYRDLIKRYHPDVVGRPGSREWQDAQRIADALNQAKNELLAARKARRSG